MKVYYFALLHLFILHCASQVQSKAKLNKIDRVINDSTFVNVTDFTDNILLDLKYATSDNFLKTNVYDCAECYLRYKTVKKLLQVSKVLAKKSLKLKLFDCYRPLDIQKKMWALVPNPNYVANPAKGSIHNRGCAVDLTLVDKNGCAFNMGTSFDFFGIEASHSYQNLSDLVKKNRLYLKKLMIKNGFNSFESEWWHYNLKDGATEKIANFKWICD